MLRALLYNAYLVAPATFAVGPGEAALTLDRAVFPRGGRTATMDLPRGRRRWPRGEKQC